MTAAVSYILNAALGPPYKDSLGRFRTQSLFTEFSHPGYSPVWTLGPTDLLSVPSLYKIYMEIGDPTEYEVALATVGSWEHWDLLTRSKWFQGYLVKWREELAVRIKSEHYKKMQEMASTGKTAQERQAAIKWLHDFSKVKGAKRGAGRPTKEEVEGALKNELRDIDDLAGDAERIGL